MWVRMGIVGMVVCCMYGCSSFNREWDKAAERPAGGVEGVWAGRWESDAGHGGGAVEAGKQDVFQYILDCKRLGCTQPDPWNAHLTSMEDSYIAKVKDAAKRVALPFGCIAVDGGHVYEESAEKRAGNRKKAHRWIEV